MTLSLVTEPSGYPITVDEAKAHMWGSIDTNDDPLVSGIIGVATNMVETYTGRKIMPQVWQLVTDIPNNVDAVDYIWIHKYPLNYMSTLNNTIQLPFAPVTDVSGVWCTDKDNVETEFASTNYTVITTEPTLIQLNEGVVWPTQLRLNAPIRIIYTIGYTTVPIMIKTAIASTVAHLYEHRGDDNTGGLPPIAMSLLDTYVVR